VAQTAGPATSPHRDSREFLLDIRPRSAYRAIAGPTTNPAPGTHS